MYFYKKSEVFYVYFAKKSEVLIKHQAFNIIEITPSISYKN